MRKVTNHHALIHGGLALYANTMPSSLAAISGIDICGIYAELDGVGGAIDGYEALSDSGRIVLVSFGPFVNINGALQGEENLCEGHKAKEVGERA